MKTDRDDMFQEPSGESDRAGVTRWDEPKTAYEGFMEEEGVPVYRGIIGAHDIRELSLGRWERMDGNGAFLYLDGLEGIKGLYVLEIPGAGALNPERHLYHEFYLVLEGRGTTQTWLKGSDSRRVFEWQPGSLFYLPPNVMHRSFNGTRERALILAATNAPPLYNMIRDREFIFDNDYLFATHYSPDDEAYYKYDEKIYSVPGNKRAQARTNYYPDIISLDLPLDNQRVPGYRRIQPAFRGFENDHNGFISQYPIGRYSRGHYHPAGAVIVCLRGGGYTFNWPRIYGTTPWKDGHDDKVRVVEYVQGGLVAAAPGGGDWFHQHFPMSREPMRILNFWGGPTPIMLGTLNRETGMSNNLTIEEGGGSISYAKEDPFIRRTFAERLSELGLESAMPPELYITD
jgi:hypothetical protein